MDRELTGERAERVKARLKEDSPETYEVLFGHGSEVYAWFDGWGPDSEGRYRAPVFGARPFRPMLRTDSESADMYGTKEDMEFIARACNAYRPAPTPPDQELRDRVEAIFERPIDTAIAAVQHWELWESNNGFIKDEGERAEQDRLRTLVDEARSQAVDAIVQLIEREQCSDCAQVHPFHASNPFDALSAEAP